nr:hypothetical protein [Mucilaginibacter sp. L294]
MNNYVNFQEKDITDVGEKDKKMSRADKLFIGCVAVFMLVNYVVTDICFEMYTQNISLAEYVGCAVVVFILLTYFCVKYIGLKRVMTYVNIIIGTFFLSALLGMNLHGVKLLYYAATGSTTATRIDINNVKKNMSKRSFMGSYVFVDYDHQELRFESSRVNYYALKNEHSMLADIGKAGANNYYITKVHWHINQKADARKQYWAYWFHKALIGVGVVAGILVVLVAAIFFKEKLGIKKPNFFTRLSALQTILLVFGAIVVLMVLIVFVLYGYMLIRYGKIGRY